MKLTKRHLHVYNIYDGKKSSLEKIGTKKEKQLFQNGEFEKIQELIQKESDIQSKKLSDVEIHKHKYEINKLFDGYWNRSYLKDLSEKYCDPEGKHNRPGSTFEFIGSIFVQISNIFS